MKNHEIKPKPEGNSGLARCGERALPLAEGASKLWVSWAVFCKKGFQPLLVEQRGMAFKAHNAFWIHEQGVWDAGHPDFVGGTALGIYGNKVLNFWFGHFADLLLGFV